MPNSADDFQKQHDIVTEDISPSEPSTPEDQAENEITGGETKTNDEIGEEYKETFGNEPEAPIAEAIEKDEQDILKKDTSQEEEEPSI